MRDYRLNLINKAISSVAGLVVSVIIARYLGVVLRGELAFITQAVGMLAVIFGMGLNQAFPYFFRTEPNRRTLDTFLRLFAVQFVFYAVAAGLLAFLVPDRTVRCLLLLLVVTVLYQQMESAMAVYHIRLKIWTNIGISVLRILAHAGMLLWLPSSLVWPVVISSGTWLAAILAYIIGVGGLSRGRLDADRAKRIVSYSWLPMFTSLLIIMNYNIDTLMLKWLGSPEDLGNYAVAAGIVVYLWVIPDAIKEVLMSRVARSSDVRAAVLPLKAAVVLGVLSVVFIIAFGPLLIPLLYGEDFAAAYGLCAVLSIGVISMIYYKVLGVVMLSEGRRVFYFATLAVAVLLNSVANLVVIPAYGAYGAAGASVASYTVTGGAFLVYFCRVKELRLRDVAVVGRGDLRVLRNVGRRVAA
ncbi:oligosaccharide flippase family protein [Rhodococcus sp. X156]|uniref:oligosaccharide flippase family protein n=1 Tax=Rhodococcus sp. X156 TaxID=2499145 RepID=UPI000FDAB184|nr:oligosaccharide flippase family protein [Rhodococcus sp. X156]